MKLLAGVLFGVALGRVLERVIVYRHSEDDRLKRAAVGRVAHAGIALLLSVQEHVYEVPADVVDKASTMLAIAQEHVET